MGQTKVMSKRLQWGLNEITCLKHLTMCLVCSKHPLQIIKPLVRNNLGHITALVLILLYLCQACSFQPASTFLFFAGLLSPCQFPLGRSFSWYKHWYINWRKEERERREGRKEERVLSSIAQKYCLQLLKAQLTRHDSSDSSICSPSSVFLSLVC